MRRLAIVLAALSLAPAASAATFARPSPYAASRVAPAASTLIQVDGSAGARRMHAAGAELIAPGLNVWRIGTEVAAGLLPDLRRAGLLEVAEPDRRLVRFNHLTAGDPLLPNEWWISHVGADRAEPPGPGVPVTVLDTGLDLSHPEFAQRPNTRALNPQSVLSTDDIHGTAVNSVVGAPANGIGVVGVYPQASLQEWDFGEGSLSSVIEGLDRASARGRTVVNFSGGFFYGGYSELLGRAVDRMLRRGSILVAAVGNDRDNGSRPALPGTLPHVLTVAATNEGDAVTSFSSRSSSVDLSAPGQDIPVAVPTFYDPSGYTVFDGTSFSSPMVAGAAAWIWTARPQLSATQVEDVLRGSARDVGPQGWDADTGYGILDIPAALALAAPPADVQEPNEDVYTVRPGGLSPGGNAPLTTRSHLSASLRASIDYTEDPEDVYRIWLPGHGRATVRVQGTSNVNVAVWGAHTKTVFERGSALRRDLIGFSERSGTKTDVVIARSKSRRGAYVYVDVFLANKVPDAAYRLSVAAARR